MTRKHAPRPRSCSRSGKRIYDELSQAEGMATRLESARRRALFVYPCVDGGFHISTVASKRCR